MLSKCIFICLQLSKNCILKFNIDVYMNPENDIQYIIK